MKETVPAVKSSKSRKPLKGPWIQYGVELLLAFLSFFLLLTVQRSIPFTSFPAMGIPLADSGLGTLLARDGFSPVLDSIGLPAGLKLFMNIPCFYLQGFVSLFLDARSVDIYLLNGSLILAVGYFFGFQLCRMYSLPPYTRVLFPLLFMANSIILEQRSYGYQMYTFALLPAVAFLGLWAFGRYCSGKGKAERLSILGILYLLQAILIFTNGYLFIMANTVLALLAIHVLLEKLDSTRSRVEFLAAYGASAAAAAVTYMLYIGKTHFWQPPISFFRASGVDLVTLLVPTRYQFWFWDLLGLSVPRTTEMFYGDGSAFTANFIGILIIPAVAGLLYKSRRRLKVVLLTGMFLTLLLSLGPSLKVGSYRIDEDTSVLNYNMPAEAAYVEKIMPDKFFHLPGVRDFRVLSRWMLAVNFFIWLMALLWIAELKGKRWGKVLSLFALSGMLLTIMPHLGNANSIGRNNYRMIDQLEKDLVQPLQARSSGYGRCIIIPYPKPSGNDYLSSLLAAEGHLNLFNAVTDKGTEYASREWPPLVRELLTNSEINGRERLSKGLEILNSGLVDCLIFTFFDPRWNSYYWPPEQEKLKSNREAFREDILALTGKDLGDSNPYFCVIR